MKLKIVTPERTVVEADVDAVYGKTVDGMIGILPKHIPLVAPLEIGVLSYTQNGQKKPLAVMGGLIRTDGESVTVLSDAAELGGEIDAVRAQHARERAKARLQQADDKVDIARAQRSLARATARLALAGQR